MQNAKLEMSRVMNKIYENEDEFKAHFNVSGIWEIDAIYFDSKNVKVEFSVWTTVDIEKLLVKIDEVLEWMGE